MTIKILGAGISGLTAAIKLSEEDKEVIIYEKNKSIGEHQKENTQSIRNYENREDQLLEFQKYGIKVNGFKPIHSIEKFAPSGKSMTVFSKKAPMFYVFKRGNNNHSIDAQLYKQALKSGVEVKFDAKIAINDCDVIACGPLFNDGNIYGIELRGVDVDPEKILFFMNNDYAPAGYIYATPYGKDSLSIAITSTNKKINLKENLEKFIENTEILRIIAKKSNSNHEFSGFAYFNIPESANIGGKLFTGGAAGFIDPARGFGLKYAVDSGIHAANSIINDKDYDFLWKTDFEDELLEGFKRRILIERMDNTGYEKMIMAEEMNAKEYKEKKSHDELEEIIDSLKFDEYLEKWQKSHDLKRLV